MTTYKLDMAAALQHLAVTMGMPVTFEQQTLKAHRIRAIAQSSARAKRRWNEAEGPPDKKSDFG